MTIRHGLSEAELESVLRAGILAPSADNHHLFRFVTLPDRILLKVSDAYHTADAETKVLAWISYGAVVENMRIQATAFAHEIETTWFGTEDVACEIRLVPRTAAPDSLLDAIPRRHTNRRFFSGPSLPERERAELDRQVSEVPGVRLFWLDALDVRKRALRLIHRAESERFRVPSLHAELFSSLKFDVGYKASCDQGIPIGAAEIEMPARPFFRLISRWRIMRVLKAFGVHAIVGWRAAYLPARLSPHIGVIAAEDKLLQSAAIQGGRGLERLWLRATQMGLEFQPFAAPTLYALPQNEVVSPSLREELSTEWADLTPGCTPIIMFRLGHAAAPSVRAGRPPLSRFLQLGTGS